MDHFSEAGQTASDKPRVKVQAPTGELKRSSKLSQNFKISQNITRERQRYGPRPAAMPNAHYEPDKAETRTSSTVQTQSVRRRSTEAMIQELNSQPALTCGGSRKGLLKDEHTSCEECKWFIYDFSNMDFQGAMRAVYVREGVQSSSYFHRADGKFMTRNCPAAVRKRKNLMTGVIMSVSIYLMLVAIFWGH